MFINYSMYLASRGVYSMLHEDLATARPPRRRSAWARLQANVRHLAAILFHPFSWPRWARRLCLLVPPIALAGWIALAACVVVLGALNAAMRFLNRFWNARPRYRYDAYSYRRSQRRRSRAKAKRAPATVE